MNALDAALSYAARSWAVLPLHSVQGGRCACGRRGCDSPGKHPRTPHGVLEATTNADVIRRWWTDWPGAGANIGIATGAESGLIVLDVDNRHGGDESLRALLADHGPLPATPTVLTGDGQHVYFAHPGGSVPNRVGLRPGLDLRGDGGFVVGPPSLHASGRRYAWEASSHPDDVPPAPLPAWLLTAFQPDGSAKAEPVAARIPEGERNATLASLAGSMRRRGMDAVEIRAALDAVNARRCDPPLSDAEVARIAESIGRYAPEPPEIDSSPIERPRGESNRLPFRTLRAVLASTPPEPPWVWEHYLARGSITIIAGLPKVGKSTLATALLGALERGEPLLDRATVPAGIVLLTEERESTLRAKTDAFGLSDSEHVLALCKHEVFGVPWVQVVSEATEAALAEGATVLVVDTFLEWTKIEDENDSARIQRALRPLAQAAARGLAVLVLFHHRKAEGTHGERVRGSNQAVGGVDIVLEIERQGGEDSTTRILRAVSRYSVTPPTLVAELRDDAYVLLGEGAGAKAEMERRRVLTFLRENPHETAEAIATALDLPKATAAKRLNALRASGEAEAAGKGVRGDPQRWRVA